MATFESVLADALKLSAADRDRLIEAVLDSLPEDREHPPLSAEWMEEIERRSAAFERGETKAIPWETVKAELIERSARRHGRE